MNQDIALQNNDLYITSGDFAVIESDTQHIADTINSFPGWWKENPADGVGVFAYLNSSGQEQTLKRAIQIQLTSDGYKVSNPQVSTDASGQLTVTPNATPNANV
ncbi:MAG: hypothetical protein WCH59_09350 [Chitinophagia bacterium]|jgi:hypothetical protein